MYPSEFDYHRAESVDEALALLSTHGDSAKLLAGGHSLLPLLKLRFSRPGHLIDIRRIPGLDGIREENGSLVIGALVTHRQVETSDLVEEHLPILSEAASVIGDPLVRNMGTVGGSLAHADPAADLPAVMKAVGAATTVVGLEGTRTIAADDFFVGMLTTALRPDEVLTEIRIPLPSDRTGGAYEKFPHPASRYALAGVAAVVEVDGGGTVIEARVAVTGLGGIATRARAAEDALEGSVGDADALARAAGKVDEGLNPVGDLQGSGEYKRNLARVMGRRALERAVERART